MVHITAFTDIMPLNRGGSLRWRIWKLDELSEIFSDKFRTTFVDKMQEIPKKLKLKNKNPIVMVGKDCPQRKIWRTSLYDHYKGNRKSDTCEHIGHYFQIVYGEDLFQAGGASSILYHPHLEADDCIAITTKRILEKDPEATVYIITVIQIISNSWKIESKYTLYSIRN